MTERTEQRMTIADKVTRAAIAETHAVIREHIRRTPVLVAHARDFGLPAGEEISGTKMRALWPSRMAA